MRAVVQRVLRASVTVDGAEVGSCGPGLLVLMAAHREDTAFTPKKMADRIWGMRILADAAGKMNVALKDVEAPEVLAVSQFTLYGDTTQRRPSFTESAPYEDGQNLFEAFVSELRSLGCKVETGVFGAHMDVTLVNDGPVTLIADIQ